MDLDWTDALGVPILVGLHVVVGAAVLVEVTGADPSWIVDPLAETARPLIERDLPLSDLELLYGVLAVGFGIVGAGTLGRGVPAFGQAYGLSRQDPVAIGDLHLQSGAVEVEGTAEPIDSVGTVPASYTDTHCLAFRAEMKEKRSRGSRRRSDWQTVEEGTATRAFRVSDDTGTVTVDPTGAKLSFERSKVGSGGHTMRTEWRLEPGESVYVSGFKRDGAADGRGPDGADTYIGADDDGEGLTISDASERWTVLRFTAKGVVLSVIGLVFLGVCLALVYGIAVA